MLFYLLSADELRELFDRLGYPFDPPTDIPRNIEYYLERTSHGSTLSRVVHSWILARTERRRSWDLFLEALESDVGDIQGGTTPEGIHLGAMAELWTLSSEPTEASRPGATSCGSTRYSPRSSPSSSWSCGTAGIASR
jgi:trehalose/maltose hydrolase-like predicted phosphorylase